MTSNPEPNEQPAPSGWDAFFRVLALLGQGTRALNEWLQQNEERILDIQTRVIAAIAELAWSIDDLRSLAADLSSLVAEEDLTRLIERGWYPRLDISSPQLRHLMSTFDEDAEAVIDVVRQDFRDKLGDIETRLVAEFPHRSQIMYDAFQAHRQAKYNLSVPVFLIQADGIWKDRYSQHIFVRGGKEAIDELLADRSDPMTRKLVERLRAKTWPLGLPEGERSKRDGFSELNRHQVLHGEVTDYGTEDFSLKAASFLYFSAFVLSEPATAAHNSDTYSAADP